MLKHLLLSSAIGSGLFSLLLAPAAAAQLDYTIDLSAEHSDNINLSSTDPISQDLLIPGIDFAFNQSGSTVQAVAAGRLEYRDYLQGAFDDEVRGQVSGLLNWVIAPHRLALSVEDYASEQPVNTLAQNVPSNLQQTNVFSAGPTLSFRLGDTLRGQTELRFIDTRASKTQDFDSERGMLALRLIKDPNPTDQLSGNLEVQHVDFNQQTLPNVDGNGPDYDSYRLFGRYQSKLARFTIDAALGWSDFVFKQGFPDQSGATGRATLGWQPTSRSSFGLGFARQFGDASNDLVVDPTQVGANVTNVTAGNIQITPQVFLENRLDMNYTFKGSRFSLRIAPFYRRVGYVNDANQDETDHGGTVDAGYLMGPYWRLGFAVGEQTSLYSSINRSDELLSFGPSLSQQFTLHWSWSLQLTRNQRNSTAPDVAYDENQVFFTLSYKR